MKEIRFRRFAGVILGVAALYLVLWWVMDVPQMHHDRRREFAWGFTYLRPFLGYVGGPLEYGYALLAQLYAFSWMGAAVLTGVLLGVYSVTRWLAAGYRCRPPVLMPFIPAIAGLLLVESRMTLVPVAAVVIAAAAALLYVRFPVRQMLARLALFAAMTWLLYYAIGGALHLFVAICVVHELFACGRWGVAPFMLVLGAATPFGTRFLLYEPDTLKVCLRNAPLEATVQAFDGITALLYLVMWVSFPAAIMMGAAGNTAWGARLKGWIAARLPKRRLVGALLTIVVLATVAMSLYLTKRAPRWTVAERLVKEAQWAAALDCIGRMPEGDRLVSHLANRALFKSGRLLHDMFNYPQYTGASALLLEGKAFDSRPRTAEKRSATYFDLGVINRAERWTLESMNVMGELPHLVRRMAIINIVKGRTGAAAIYLGKLKRMPFQGAWARDCEDRLGRDTLLEHDRDIQFLRAAMFKPDYVDTLTSEELLRFCLATNPKNKMAFDYLMSLYLLTRRSDKIVEHVKHLRSFGYEQLPRHCEEAILSHMQATGKSTALAGGYAIGSETTRRFNEFLLIYARHAGNPAQARALLAKKFGDTYWFFEAFGLSGRAFVLGTTREHGPGLPETAEWQRGH